MPDKEEEGKTGVNASLYLSKEADDVLDRVAAAAKRSRSDVVSLMLEIYGPELLNDPGKLVG